MKLTLGTTYYNCPEKLKEFLNHHRDFFDEIIIVDDGSTDLAKNHIEDRSKIKLYRVPIDYGFNSHGCRNLIMKEASNDWVMMFDVDRLLLDPKFAVESIKSKKLSLNTLYLFEMFIDHNDPKTIHVSVNDFLVNKNHFWKAGGYDEELIGVRTGDRQYREQLLNFGKEKILYGIRAKFTRGPSMYLKITSKNDKKKFSKEHQNLLKRRIRCPEPNKPTLTFDWYREF